MLNHHSIGGTLLAVMIACAPAAVAKPASGPVASADAAALAEAVTWMKMMTPSGNAVRWEYEMTARVRLLLFWVTKDDVGGGFIRHATGLTEDGMQRETMQVLFGSDPAKCPRAINRWGGGTELLNRAVDGTPVSSAFFGFMKSSKGASVEAMQHELSSEKDGAKFYFDATVNRVDAARALSRTVPFQSSVDFNLRQYDDAERMVWTRMDASERPVKVLPAASSGCNRTAGFLATMDEMVKLALDGVDKPTDRCYVYNGRLHTATLVKTSPVAERTVHAAYKDGTLLDHTYRNMAEAKFEILDHEKGDKSNFTLLIGKDGELRGVPVQIFYQPNWWFQVQLNLK